jgi:Uma2 family endonuclease
MAVISKITLDEFLHMKDEKPALEYACGKVFQKPMPTRTHSKIQMFLSVVLFQFLARTGLGEVLPEFRCIFGPPGRARAYVPDLAYVSKERTTGQEYLYTAPDLAIEIVSPGQNIARLLDKAQFYLLSDARLVWVIDSGAETIAVLAPGQESQTLSTGDTLDGGDVLPGFSLPVDDIFGQIKP